MPGLLGYKLAYCILTEKIFFFTKKKLTAAAVLLTRDTLYKQRSMFLGLEFKTFTTDLKLISCTI